MAPAEEATAHAKGAPPSSVESGEDVYLCLQPAATTATQPGSDGSGSGSGGSSVGGGGGGGSRGGGWGDGDDGASCAAITVLACGATEPLAREVERRFWTCLHRLRDALQHRRVLPGAGGFEGACIARLELHAEAAMATAMATAMAGAGAGVAELRRREAALAVGGALRGLLLATLRNGGVDADGAAARVDESVGRWRALVVSETRLRLRLHSSTADAAARWTDAAWCPLLGIDGTSAVGAAAEPVYDAYGAKLAGLTASVDTVQLALLSDAVLTNQPALRHGAAG